MAKKSNTDHYSFTPEAEALLVAVQETYRSGLGKKGARTRPEGVRLLYTPALDVELLKMFQPYAEAFGLGNTEAQKEIAAKVRVDFAAKTGQERSDDSIFYRIHKLLKQGALADLNYRSSLVKSIKAAK